MKKVSFLLLILFLGIYSSAQHSSKNYALIEFIGDKTENSKTFIGKIKKGNPNRLHDYLQQSRSTTQNEQDFAPKEYNNKKEKEKLRHLSDIYDINEKKLKKNNEKYHKKYLEEKKRIYTEEIKKRNKKEKDPNKFSLKRFLQREKIPKTKLSKQYKIRGKRIRKGKTLKYPEGNISLIIKYKVREDKIVKEYVTDVNTKVVSGFKYYLTYYGTDSKRRYYITQTP